MKNIRNSEILKTYDEKRTQFKPYGLTCERWKTYPMKQADRHNEIELNFLPAGSITYLHGSHLTRIPVGKLTIFWGLIPHRITEYEENTRYYVCTIPLSIFLSWKLPADFVNGILHGKIMTEADDIYGEHDIFMIENWIDDLKTETGASLVLKEMQCRMTRMADHTATMKESALSPHTDETKPIEQIALYIAKNYKQDIRVADIGHAVGLHPDYANNIFKKAFGHTLTEQITLERIAYAQRQLITTDTSIIEIAYECGFNSISCFNAAFLKINRCTPREYRKKYCR